MAPTYQQNSVLIISTVAYHFTKPKVNDCIVCYDPRDNREILKRIIRVKDNHFWVEGDNASSSTDSRTFGYIQKRAIIGKVIWQF